MLLYVLKNKRNMCYSSVYTLVHSEYNVLQVVTVVGHRTMPMPLSFSGFNNYDHLLSLFALIFLYMHMCRFDALCECASRVFYKSMLILTLIYLRVDLDIGGSIQLYSECQGTAVCAQSWIGIITLED